MSDDSPVSSSGSTLPPAELTFQVVDDRNRLGKGGCMPIRRLLLAGRDDAEVTAAWIRVPGSAVESLEQRYTHDDGGRWTYASLTGFEAPLEVDDDGLVVTYVDRWRRPPV